MKRKVLSILLSIALIIVAVVPAFTVANAAVWTGSLSIPSISGGVYQIATGENLAWFANAVNTGNTEIKGILTADIQLNSANSTSNEWTPIGTEANPFKGSFDGNGFTISGMCVNEPTAVGVGFFGYVIYPASSNAPEDVSAEYIVGTKTFMIKNIILTNSSVTGKQNVGGIVGYASNAGILDCSYSGTVNGSENSIGGIVGWASASTVVSQCHSTGTLTGHQRVGGIVGFNNGNSVVTKCYGDMTVTGYMNVGGIVGTLSAASMLGCFFLGSVSAEDRAGGLVGYSAFGNMTGAYTISTVTNTADGEDFGGAVGVIYGGTYSSIFYSYETSGVDGPEGIGRTAQEMKLSNFVKELNHTTPYFCFDYTEINNGYPVLTWMLRTDVWAGDRTMPATNSSGTYLISKPSELAWFAGLVNGTLSGFEPNPAANATVTDNLLFNINVYDDSMGINEWIPIGTDESPYTGTFNGGGYNLAGLYTSPTAGTDGVNVGLFGYVGAGSITGTVVIDGLICGKENVGGLVGYLMGGTVSNSVCSSEIQGDKAVGGIVGNVASVTSTVTTCGMMGTITGVNFSGEPSFHQNVGGIAGYSNRATVTKCFVSTNINASSARHVGGLLGNNSNGSVTSSYSISTVNGKVMVGGLIGNNNNGTVNKCYTVGKITGTSQVGMGFGFTSGSNVSSCFYDSSYKTVYATETAITAKTSTQMTGSSSVSNLGLGSDFKATADDTYFYYYPQIYSASYSSINVLRNASVDSVRRVQSRYIARVEIDGRTDTYYETLEDAFSYASSTASSILPTVFLVRDYELTATQNISATVGFFGENGAVLTRASTLTGAMINVTGNLTIGSSIYGDDSAPDFFIDGNNVQATESAITVQSGARLNVSEGVCVRNCRTASTSVRGAAVKVNGGELVMTGGAFSSNVSRTVGGAIYNEEGTVTVRGGTFSGGEATQGAAIYNNNGTLTITGGTFTENIASNYGGAVTGYGVYSQTVISGTATFNLNEATYGGALAVMYYGTLNIDGGEITENRAYSQGGALYVEDGAEAYMTGGSIAGNEARSPSEQPVYGGAVYVGGDFSIKGAAKLEADNDVYIPTGKYLTIADRLTCSGYAATITPAVYTAGTKVLNGTAMSSNYTKIGVSNAGWRILASGKLTNTAATNVAVVSKNNAYSVEYISLADAFASVEDGETAIITVVADNMINEVIPVHGDVTLTCDEETHVSMRSGSFYGVMFDVYPDAVLRLGDTVVNSQQQAQADYAAGTLTAGQMIIDGGSQLTGVTGAAAVNVRLGGTLCMNDDAIIRNCLNTTTSAVTVSGTMDMYGGTISDNSSCYGGAIYVKSTGVLNTYGGVIAGNTSTHGGSAVYSEGRVNRNVHSYEYFYIETLYEDGVVIGMADPVYVMTVNTDILIADGEDVFLNSNLIYMGETDSPVYVRYLTDLPDETDFTFNNMTIDLNTYTVGNLVLMGTDVATYYTGFTPLVDGYCIESNGKLGINKIIPKPTSGMTVNRDKAVISGLDLNANTVGVVAQKFVNDRLLLRFYSAKGTAMTNTKKITTGCSVRLLNASNQVIDTLTFVVYGDINADEQIDGQDAVLARAVAAGMLNPTNSSVAEREAADVNRDNSVTLIDAEYIEASGLYLQTVEQTA